MNVADIIAVSSITLLVYSVLGTALYLASDENNTFAALWCMGIVYWVLYIIGTPVRWIRKHRGRR